MDSWRLAAPGMVEDHGPRSRRADAEPPVGDLTLEDLRQFASQCGRDLSARHAARWLGTAARLNPAVDGHRAVGDRVPVAIVAGDLANAAAAGPVVARLLRSSGQRRNHECPAVRPGRGLSAAPGGRLGRRHHPHSLQAPYQPPETSRVADGISGRARAGSRLAAGDVAKNVAGDGVMSGAGNSDRPSRDDWPGREPQRAIPVRDGDTAAGAGMGGEPKHRVRAQQPGHSRRSPPH